MIGYDEYEILWSQDEIKNEITHTHENCRDKCCESIETIIAGIQNHSWRPTLPPLYESWQQSNRCLSGLFYTKAAWQ